MHATEAERVYVGADLHGNNVFLSVIDPKGRRVMKRRVKADLEAVNEALHPYWERVEAVAVESTYNWYWFVDGLREQGRDIRLGNPAKMEQYDGLKVTNDSTDATWLAEQLRLGILPESYVYPKEGRAIRDALRRRRMFVRQRTQSMLSLEALLARQGIASPGVKKIMRWHLADIQALGLDDFTELQLSSLLESVRKHEALSKQIESKVLEKLKPSKAFQRVQQVSGIGPILGMTILLESGAFQRFPSAGDYASYCRAVKSKRLSNGKAKGRNNGRNGNPYLAWAYVEAATFAARYDPVIHRWYERKKKRRNGVVAKKALACKLSKAVWHVMQGEDYDKGMLFG